LRRLGIILMTLSSIVICLMALRASTGVPT
jgi:hypothetical protein